MKLNAQRRFERLNLYGLVQGLSYVVRLNDPKSTQHLRARLASVLRHPGGMSDPLHSELKQLFAISGLWVRNDNRHDTKRQIQQLIRRITPRLKVRRWRQLRPGR
jgi:hypothetical protein